MNPVVNNVGPIDVEELRGQINAIPQDRQNQQLSIQRGNDGTHTLEVVEHPDRNAIESLRGSIIRDYGHSMVNFAAPINYRESSVVRNIYNDGLTAANAKATFERVDQLNQSISEIRAAAGTIRQLIIERYSQGSSNQLDAHTLEGALNSVTELNNANHDDMIYDIVGYARVMSLVTKELVSVAKHAKNHTDVDTAIASLQAIQRNADIINRLNARCYFPSGSVLNSNLAQKHAATHAHAAAIEPILQEAIENVHDSDGSTVSLHTALSNG